MSVEISTGKNGCCLKFSAVRDSRYIIQIQWKYQGIGEKSERLRKCLVKKKHKGKQVCENTQPSLPLSEGPWSRPGYVNPD